MVITSDARAQLKIEGTRLIYLGRDKEANITVINPSAEERLMQSWISRPDDGKDIPFAISQPLALIPPGGRHLVRVFYAGQGLPSDHESVFWLNILEIPRKPEQADTMQFAIRQRIKLFYRPTSLADSSIEAVRNLRWRKTQQRQIEVSNPSAFHVSLVDLELKNPDQSQKLPDYIFLRPGESLVLDTHSAVPNNSDLYFSEITDIGLQKRHHVTLP
ncbi:TPA: molecular chaperone [Pseudomonas aeruginosa]|nr:molecular chaperone [Pseudomonas aeruginosa]HBO3680269.1 molecular chaperone [Pseudomonas aeruginosa]HBO3968843.1 molecular chaperone [Pseudomonas aeruginosa]HCD6626379.1 molecular chaperone [Pseudomonas aeruginosa]HCR1215052.1 molecular chaperone [Pseudomonas aeruginosa]